ncbi:uncharacterized protein LOC112690515 isoform X2 [Sipha flava]|uniref:Uncharacterized protein LOC112690515 isoform X2 n=1 Tax=Sipha flava TaxID=143950 RepID=A0A8B8GCJ3_9HEMI|nr:uncharacterized protein LOC112690515 isoform X2 [Sipha flava]
MDDVKTIVRSILVSYPGNCTISQLLDDYVALEGQHLPYKKLGFNNVLDVIKNMNDILKVPPHPSLNSFVKLVIDEKTLHLRQLVMNQKVNKKKKRYPRKYCPGLRENVALNNSYVNSNNYENHTNECNAFRGYDFVKKMEPVHSKKKGYVTNQLQKSIENLCKNVQNVSIRVLKNNLINHPDYKLLNSHNIEEAINMLKYFIYIDKSGVHLKNSSYEIFPTDSLKKNNRIEPKFKSVMQNITNEDEELAMDDYGIEVDIFSETEYFDNLAVDYQQSKTDNTFIAQRKKESSNELTKKTVDNQQSKTDNTLIAQGKKESSNKTTEETVDNQQSKTDNTFIAQGKKESSNKMTEETVDNQQSKTNNTFIAQEKIKIPKIANNLTVSNIGFKAEVKVNKDKKHSLIMDKEYYKKAITSVIEFSQTPITINQALKNYEQKYGSSFPIQKFSCRSSMDFFRLYPALFLLDNPYSTNSIIKIAKPMKPTEPMKSMKPMEPMEPMEHMEPKQKNTIRQNFINASYFMYNNNKNSKMTNLIQNENALEQTTDNINHQKMNENALELVTENISHQKINENVVNRYFLDSSDSCIEIRDSELILDSMKNRMRSLLNKYKNGILCDAFMEVYGKEYKTYFTYSEYGFKSMRDMAYNLPSVFYVYVTECGEYYLYNASRRKELKIECHDPFQYYKNIPKSILKNLSILFDNHQNGIKFHELKFLYCSKFGRLYEPLKYGYSSERHMFESLNKMVKIENNIVYTINPYAYIPIENNDEEEPGITPPVLPVQDFLLNYSGNDVYGGRFVYPKLDLGLKKIHKVYAAEIYGPNYFYLHLARSVDNLNSFMDRLQCFILIMDQLK